MHREYDSEKTIQLTILFYTVSPEFFARVLFSRTVIKDIFAMLQICDNGKIYLYHLTKEQFCHFAGILFSQNFAYAKFCKNKSLTKISEFTVHMQSYPVIGLTFIFIHTLCLSAVKALKYVTSLL